LPDTTLRVVLDTNTLLRGLASERSAARRVLRAAEHRLIIPLLSKPLLDEYRAVLTDPELVERFPQLTAELVAVSLHRLRFVSDYIRSPDIRFRYSRDPRDEKLIELAIALRASHIITGVNDLLSLPANKGENGNRFRQRLSNTAILTAHVFLRRHGLWVP
jgi:putative PIN family toxin of toxin-antitoxin system